MVVIYLFLVVVVSGQYECLVIIFVGGLVLVVELMVVGDQCVQCLVRIEWLIGVEGGWIQVSDLFCGFGYELCQILGINR